MLPDLGLLVDPKVWLLLLVSRICLVDHGEHAGWLAGLGEGHEEAGCLRGWLEVPEQLVAGEVGTGDGEDSGDTFCQINVLPLPAIVPAEFNGEFCKTSCTQIYISLIVLFATNKDAS